MAAWTRAHGKDDSRNPHSRINANSGLNDGSETYLSARLHVGEVYSRAQLGSMLGIEGKAMGRGVFRREGTASVLLFVTERKTPDRTQYADHLDGDTLHWEGPEKRGPDRMVIEHEERGLELLLFYRERKDEFPDYGFRYVGPFDYASHQTPEGDGPTSFVLRRVGSVSRAAGEGTADAEALRQSTASVAALKTWVFQANPRQFDITGFLATHPKDFLWVARQRVGDMAVGDRVFVWRAIGGGDPALSGVIAEAEIAEQPRSQPEDAASLPFWTGAAGSDPKAPQMRVRLRLLHRADEIIRRGGLLDDPVLSTMQVLTARTGTNFLLSPEHASALRAIWDEGTEIERDVAEIRADTQIDKTTRKALIDARRGQGKFRSDLMKRWGGACAVLGITVKEVLRASHIKPWREATNAERLDPANGLLLAAHLDALFDTRLISFVDDGTMLVSSQVSAADRALLGVPRALRLPLDQHERAFMAIHRGTKFQV